MSRQSNVHKEQITLYLTDAVVAELDRQRAATEERGEVSRNAHAVFLLERALMARAAPAAKPRKIIRRGAEQLARDAAPAPENEGARLRAARDAAGLTQPQLAEKLTGDVGHVSRNQIHRAERAASLDGYPALRAWLQAQETRA